MSEACESCDLLSDELCQDGYCRDCHKSLSFESCVDGSWARGFRASQGMPPLEEIEQPDIGEEKP